MFKRRINRAIFLCSVLLSANYCKEKKSTENLRPQIHFTSQKNWINDPNGLIFLNGNYHMFFQHNPFGNDWGHMSWGHAISKDLYHWKEKPIVLREKGSIYPRMKFSGSTVWDSQNTSGLCKKNSACLIAVYTEWTLLNQTQNLAVSHDGGFSFVEYRDNPVIDENSWSFRDPKVFWHHKTAQWIMVVAKPSASKIAFYASKNLINWTHLSDFSAIKSSEGIWECPDLFYLPTVGNPTYGKWILLTSVAETARGSYMQYFVGDFDGKNFKKEPSPGDAKILDYGYDFYAAISWENLPPANRVIVGWMNNWEYANSLPTYPWKGTMSVPRKLSLLSTNGDYRILQTPEPQIEKYKRKIRSIDKIFLDEKKIRIPLNQSSFVLESQFSKITAEEVGVMLKTADEAVVVAYNRKTGVILVDRGKMQKVWFAKKKNLFTISEAFIGRHDKIDFNIIVDKSTIEVFALDGQVVLSNMVFPKEIFSHIEFYANKGSANVTKIALSSITRDSP